MKDAIGAQTVRSRIPSTWTGATLTVAALTIGIALSGAIFAPAAVALAQPSAHSEALGTSGGGSDVPGSAVPTSPQQTREIKIGGVVPVARGTTGRALAPKRSGVPRQVAGTLPPCPTNSVTGQAIVTPYVTSIAPAYGPTSGNTTITINGGNFTGCESVTQSYTYSQGSVGPPVQPDSITVTTSITTYQFTVTGLELDSTNSPSVRLGAQEVTPGNNNSFTALTPPGPICSSTTTMTVLVFATLTSQSFGFSTKWTGTSILSLGPPYPSPPYPGYPAWPNQPNPMTCDEVAVLNSLYPDPPYSPGVCTPQPSSQPATSQSQSPVNSSVTFTYVNEGAQDVACNSSGVPYDLANSNAITVQMADELTQDVNAERANYDSLHPSAPQLAPLSVNQKLVKIAEFWANGMASGVTGQGSGAGGGGGGGGGASGGAGVASSDSCILPEVVASGYGSGSPIIWAAENAGTFNGTGNTGQMNKAFESNNSTVSTTTLTLNGSPIGGSGCQAASGGGTPTTQHNYFSNTYTDMGVAVACSGGSGASPGACFVAQVFAGHDINTPVQPDCADKNFTLGFTCPSAARGGGGTQAQAVVPPAPVRVKATIDSVPGAPGGQYRISVTWGPPPAGGYDPVNMFVVNFTDIQTGSLCVGDLGANLNATSAIGCVNGTNVTYFTNDQYVVTVRAVNDLCGSGCAPAAIYPPPSLAGNCVKYGNPGYPQCPGDSSSPDGPWALASPDPVQWTGAVCNANTLAGNGQCNPPPPPGGGYRLVAPDGGVFAYGGDGFYGSMGAKRLNAPMVGIAGTPDGGGYWTVAADGGVFTFGDAPFYGSTGGLHLAAPIIAMAPTPDGGGYWLLGEDGGIFSFGDARYMGSPVSTPTCGGGKPSSVAGMAVTPDGQGYWIVSTGGSVYNFGDATCLGSGPSGNPYPTVGIAATPDGAGYWLADANGDVYSFGDAVNYGNAVGSAASQPVLGIVSSPDGKGYWLLVTGGYLDTYGDATYSGSPATLVQDLPPVHWPVAMESG